MLAVNTGDRLVLIDAGSRGKMQPTAGRLLQNLAAAEIKPEEVDTILITHAHPDHLWGVANASDTERTFPNAEYVIGEAELNFWMQPQHPLESHANWGGTLSPEHENTRGDQGSHPDCEARRRGGPGHHGDSHARAHARAYLGADRVRFQPDSLYCGRCWEPRCRLPAPRLARRVRPGSRPGREDASSLPGSMRERESDGLDLPSPVPRELAMSFAPAQRSAGFQAIGAGTA